MNTKKLSKPIWLVMTGFSCNNNCIMCSTRPKANFYPDRATDEIIEDLVKGRKEGYSKVEFTGGEPTIRPDILYLVKIAKDFGYKDIAVSTNGRMLSYDDFARKLIENGVRRINFSLYGPKAEIHNAVTRTPKTFEQTIQGIKNIQKFPGVVIIVNTVVSQLNYSHLTDIGKFILSLKIKFFNILDLVPDGYAKDFYETLVVRINDLSDALNNLENILDKFNLITFFDFPLCLFKPEIKDNSHATFITAEGRKNTAKQVGYRPVRFKKEENDIYTDIHKERMDICAKCRFYKECGGIWKDYLNLYREEEIKDLAIRHNCLGNLPQ